MQYYRCKCGSSQSWGSMGPALCASCSKCGSDLATSPELHREPRPHEFRVEKVMAETDDGEVEVGEISRCFYCSRTKKEIKMEDVYEKT